ncbi:MAG: hypothetical protein HYT68_01570 [Candidatus Zambryskibacteria bacterium]|nr:hypothetical protein [Candidatus Zambryskibacteria bacterium]
MTTILAFVASVFTIISVGSYFKQLIKNESIPNPATWLIWLVVTIINTATYFLLSNRDIWISLVSVVLTVGILSIFIFAMVNGKFIKLGRIEVISLLLAITVGVFWQVSNDPKLANVALQLVFLISFYPTIIGLLKHHLRESPLPWFSASISYILQILIVFININSIGIVGFAFPVINLIGNGTVGLISWKQGVRP